MKHNSKSTLTRSKSRAKSTKAFSPIHAIVPTRLIPDFRGPKGEKTTVAIGWHVDGETGILAADQRSAQHITALGEAAYGVSTALPRILQMHRDTGVPGSFFVPGYVCDCYPREIGAIASAGYEIAHHGYLHENCFTLTDKQERSAFNKGIKSIKQVYGRAPAGWSAPSWGVKPSTMDLIKELGMLYDCSLMEYDTPYVLSTEHGELIELPTSMILDDWEIYGGSPYPGSGINAPADLAFQIWREEFDALRHYGGLFATTFHPNLTGRPGRLRMMYGLIEYMQQFSADVWFATCEEVALQAQKILQKA